MSLPLGGRVRSAARERVCLPLGRHVRSVVRVVRCALRSVERARLRGCA